MITKAIIPVAGIGSRFLPASKSIPKEMFPLVDKPVIQYIVEEAIASGITDIIFITSPSKRPLEDFFDTNLELEHYLIKKKRDHLLQSIRNLEKQANFCFIRQTEPKGDGHAILCARHLIGRDEPFLVSWGDDVIIGEEPAVGQLMKIYERYLAPVFAVEEVEKNAVDRYGIIQGAEVEKGVYQVSHIVEKPEVHESPSTLAIVGRYILTWEVLEELVKQNPADDGEIRTSHALRDALSRTSVYAYKFEGRRFDCGNKLGWLKANVYLGLQDEEIGNEFDLFLKGVKLLSH